MQLETADSKGQSLTPYLLLGLLALVFALLAGVPASLMKKALPAPLASHVAAWGGTVWNGQAAWQADGEAGQLRWKLNPWRLFLGQLSAQVESQGALQLTGRVALGFGGWSLSELKGQVPGALVRRAMPGGWDMPGDLRAENVAVGRKGMKGAWTQAGGRLLWNGGAMRYSINGQTQEASLPPLALGLRLDNDTLSLQLVEQAGNLGLAAVRIGPDNMAETQLRQRLLGYTPGYRGQGAPDQVVVTAKQPL